MRMLILLAALCVAVSGYGVSNDDLRTIMDKKTAAVSDAIYLIYSIDNPASVQADVALVTNARIQALDKGADLDAGAFAIIAIEMKKARGGILYALTGFTIFAAQSLVYDGLYTESFSWNRPISGKELIELTSALKNEK